MQLRDGECETSMGGLAGKTRDQLVGATPLMQPRAGKDCAPPGRLALAN